MKNKRPHGRSSGPKPNSDKPEGGRGSFEFRDRSGKVHTIGGKRPESDASHKPSRSSRPIGGKVSAPVPVEPDPEYRRDFSKRFNKKKRSEFGREENRERYENRQEDRSATREVKDRFGKKKKFSKEPRFPESDKRGKKPGHFKDRNQERPGKKFRDSDRNEGFKSRGRSKRKPGWDSPSRTSEAFRLRATVDKNRKGFGFLQFDNRGYEDAFISPRDAERFFHGDRVEAVVNDQGEVIELQILEHRIREFVGRYHSNRKNGIVVYERKKTREEVECVGDTKSAKDGEWVRAKMLYADEDSSRFECEIVEVYGEAIPARADVGIIAAEYGLIEEHSAEAVREAETFKLDLNDPGREDLTHVPFITIDGETARDFDDAIYVERERDGFILWVAIADVSHYVRDDTALNDEALSRGTSVYFPERAFHMLPRALSENLCSLRPNEKRLTMVAKMEYDRSGKRVHTEIMNALIESRRRATYNEIQAEWEKNQKNSKWEYAPHFELYQIIRKTRTERGSIDFDLPEAEIKVDENGEPTLIALRPRLDAHRLIEEFMIAANEAVTDHALERKFPFVYRVHDDPPMKALEKLQELAGNSGVDFFIDQKDIAASLMSLIEQVQEHPANFMLNMAVLRSMAQAHYSAVYGEHFGLASKGYTHFTSPIRRYPDLVVHRMLKLMIHEDKAREKLSRDRRDELEAELAKITEHCSYRERIAADAEREAIRLKQLRVMMKEVGNEFEGKISGMNDKGMFVRLSDPFVEGFVPVDSFIDDSYQFVEERMSYVGRRKKRTFKIGDTIQIRVDRVDFDLRTIDFAVLA